jgi:antitoxin MazE
MRAKIIRIGNSRGIRLPKPILEASGFGDEVELKVEEGRVILMRPQKHPREGWAESIAAIGPDDEDWSDWDNLSGEALEEDWTWPEDFKWPDEPIVSTYISPPSTPSEAPKSPKRGRARSSRRTR